jgi:hypothetical protein
MGIMEKWAYIGDIVSILIFLWAMFFASEYWPSRDIRETDRNQKQLRSAERKEKIKQFFNSIFGWRK